MAFKRNSASTRRWKTWLQQNRDELLACGIPLVVLENESSWCYFLDHGCFTIPGSASPAINIDRMANNHAERLCHFLEHSDLYPANDTLRRLQHLLNRTSRTQNNPTSA